MSKPTNKQELLQAIEEECLKLGLAFQGLSETVMCRPGACGDWSVKDILAHLADWEKRCLRWVQAGLRGEVPKTPDEHFNWGQLRELNHEIFLQYQDLTLDEVLERYQDSHKKIMAAIHSMTEEELFTPQRYAWTAKQPLVSYIAANTSSHYRWASKLIQKFVRSAGENSKMTMAEKPRSA